MGLFVLLLLPSGNGSQRFAEGDGSEWEEYDEDVWNRMNELATEGVKAKPDGKRPLDAILRAVIIEPEVVMGLSSINSSADK